MDEQERSSIVNEVLELVILKLPEVVGNLITNQMEMSKISKKFYDKYPEFKPHSEVVRSVINEEEHLNTLDKFENILERSVPRIRERIHTVKNLNVKTAEPPKRETLNGVF